MPKQKKKSVINQDIWTSASWKCYALNNWIGLQNKRKASQELVFELQTGHLESGRICWFGNWVKLKSFNIKDFHGPELDLDLNKQTWGLFTYNGSVSSRKAQLLYIEMSPFSTPIRDGFAKNHPSKKEPIKLVSFSVLTYFLLKFNSLFLIVFLHRF